MADAAEAGRQLEQRILGFFQTHGYRAKSNEVLEGRSGGRHEIDVLAEKSDALTTYRVAVECKAWQQPIEKDVVSKLHYVMGDLGLNKGIIVSLAGCRAGAERTAADLGIDLWGPDDLRRLLGDSAVGDLSVGSVGSNETLALGHSFITPGTLAERRIRSAGKGSFGLLTHEPLRWFAPVWLPAYCVRLTVAQQELQRRTARIRSSTFDNLYDAIEGCYLGGVSGLWEEIAIDQQSTMRATLRDTTLHTSLRKAVQDFARVSSPSAVQRHSTNLQQRGLPPNCSSVSIDHTLIVHLPYYVGILESAGRQRVVAVGGRTGDVSEIVSRLLTTNLAQLRNQIGR